MPFKLDAEGLRDLIARNLNLAQRAEGEGNAWLARELEDIAREAADQLAAFGGGRSLADGT